MNKLPKLVLVLAGAVLLTVPAVQAQSDSKSPAREGAKGGGPGAGELAERLGLSADQRSQVAAIMQRQREQMQALAPEERREKGRAIREEGAKAINAILTPEQRSKWAEMRANAPQGVKGEGRKGEGPKGGKGGKGDRAPGT
jgi:Spy/CpxP family protein refolding chaperone